jgi:hypothetical protein
VERYYLTGSPNLPGHNVDLAPQQILAPVAVVRMPGPGPFECRVGQSPGRIPSGTPRPAAISGEAYRNATIAGYV